MFPSSAPIIFCETTGDWAVAARSYLSPELPVVQTRSIADLTQTLAGNPTAIAAVEWQTERAAWLLDQLIEIRGQFPIAPLVVLATRSQAAWEGAVREAGADHFIVSTRRLSELAQIEAHHRRIRALFSLYSEEPADLEQRILASLPWGS